MWLNSVRIAVHDFTIIHERSPSQRTITYFFQQHASEDSNPSTSNVQVIVPANDDSNFMLALIYVPEHKYV
eukprot:12232496-Ditylum_brightwellii.AAC.1